MKLLAVLIAVLLSAPPAHAAVRVVTTVPDLAAIVTAVGGEHVKVSSMALPSQDPHFVDARPSLALALSRADLLVTVGLDLEVGWLPVLLTGSRNPRVQKGSTGYLDASTLVEVLDVPTTRPDRAQGDIHPGGNPHYLHDPRRGAAVARGVADRLSTLDPARSAAYNGNLDAFLAELEALIPRWEARAASLRGAPVVTYHRSMVYLAEWLGFVTVAELEPKPGIPPSPAHVARVLGLAREVGVRVVLQEDWYPSTTSRTFAEKLGARLAVIPGGAASQGGQGYLEHLDELIEALAGGDR